MEQVVEKPQILPELLTRAAEFPGTGLRFLDRRERPTFYEWSEIRSAAFRVAEGLRARGIGRGDRVALIHPTCIELIQGLFGIQLAGAAPVPLYPPVRLGRLDEYHPRAASLMHAAGARLALVDSKVAKLLGKTCELAGLEQGFATVDQVAADGASARDAASIDVERFAHGVGPEDLALVQFSSGTTVEPKPVALSYRAISAQVAALNSFWPDPEDRKGNPDPKPHSHIPQSGVSWLPLDHDMGLIGCVFPALERPSVLTLIGPEVFVAKPAVWLRAISRWRATISVAPNFAYGLCVNKIRDHELQGVDLSHWWVALNGAEPVAPSVLRAFQQRFARWGFRPEALTPVYGLSEATLAVTFSELDQGFYSGRFNRNALVRGVADPDPDGRELISVGRPLPGTEVAITHTGNPPAAGPPLESRIGRIWVRGPSVMEGYLDRPEATANALRDGWLDTGDLGFFHRGRLFIHGREKDVLILRGRNHSPIDVEQAVDGVPGIRIGCSVAVSYLPEDGDRELLMLFVEARKDISATDREQLVTACREAVVTSCGLRIDRLEVVAPGTLPRTSSGKLRRAQTLRLFLDDDLRRPVEVGPVRLASELLGSAIAYSRAKAEKPVGSS